MALLACSGPTGLPPVPAPSPSTAPRVSGLGSTQQVLDDALLAARRGDRATFLRQLSPRDPAFDDRARQLFRNLSGLALSQLQARLLPEQQRLTSAREQVLGADAWMQAATVTWRLAGDRAAAEHRVWFTFVRDGVGVRLAGLIDRPTNEPALQQPSWWLGPVEAERRGPVTVVVGSGQSPGAWRTKVEGALAQVLRHLPAATGSIENPTLVVEVPATSADFERIVGTPTGSYADIAAATVAEGNTPQAAQRIVVNPDAVRRLSAAGLNLTLTHEAVHVLTRSPESPAPAWAVEGLADWVALQAYPEAGPAVAGPLLSEVAGHGPPAALPPDAEFEVGSGRLGLAYAEAWFACRYVATSTSPDRLGRLYRELDRGRTLDQAADTALGRSAADLTAGWRGYLRAEARQR